MGKIFIIMGPSNSGKDTILSLIKEEYNELLPIVLYTNRPIRENEINGVDYNFIDIEELNNMDKNKELIERRDYNTVYGIWSYATSNKNIDLENNSYISINTLEGYNSLKNYYGDKVIPIFIKVDDITRLERAIEREKHQDNPKLNELCRRFLADSEDFSKENLVKANITNFYYNYDLNECVNEIKQTINKELIEEKRKIV